MMRIVGPAAAMARTTLTATFVTVALAIAPAAAADDLTPEERAQFEALIHDYIMANPEVIVDAVKALREREQQAAREQAQQNLVALRDQLVDDPYTPIAGNPDGKVTIVEFFDYRCGYCKSSLAVVRQMLQEDPEIRIAFKEFPILSPQSRLAARAALASKNQGKYFEYHNALMTARGKLERDQIMEIAAEVGLDVDQLAADMKDPRVQAELDANAELAKQLNITGTPTFIVGDQLYPGALSIEALRTLVQDERTG